MEKINQVWRIKKLQVDISCLKKLSFWEQSNHAHDQIIPEGGFQRVPSNASLWQLFEHFFLNFLSTVVIFGILKRYRIIGKGKATLYCGPPRMNTVDIWTKKTVAEEETVVVRLKNLDEY